MAKRARGSSTRPGQRPPTQRTTARPPATSRPSGGRPDRETALGAYGGQSLTDADLARRPSSRRRSSPRRRPPSRPRSPRRGSPRHHGRPARSPRRAADEYAYVARDVRRIVLIGGSLIALLVGPWAVIQVTGAGPF